MSDATLPAELQGRLGELRRLMAGLGGAVVAYSGGVDSTLLAYVARQELGDCALACTAASPSMAPEDLEGAAAVARWLGIRHRVVTTDEVENQAYLRNTPDRCYVCRRVVFTRLLAVRREEGLGHLVHGAHLDDRADFRPGARAAAELEVRAPLAEAGLSKADVRALARAFGFPNAERPSSPCLSSRIPYGERVTVERLGQVAAAERALRGLGFAEVRVRHHGAVARIEIPTDQLQGMAESSTRLAVVAALTRLGFAYVALDLQGFRSGSLNEVLPLPTTRTRLP